MSRIPHGSRKIEIFCDFSPVFTRTKNIRKFGLRDALKGFKTRDQIVGISARRTA